jgi:hypothetical protein
VIRNLRRDIIDSFPFYDNPLVGGLSMLPLPCLEVMKAALSRIKIGSCPGIPMMMRIHAALITREPVYCEFPGRKVNSEKIRRAY